LLGDAAGYVEPFTGQGMAWAIDSAIALAPLAHRAVHDWQPNIGTEWAATYRQVVGRRQLICRAISGVLRHPSLCGILADILSKAPGLVAPLVRRIHSA
jgi:flavin-dependent dehydrogenase